MPKLWGVLLVPFLTKGTFKDWFVSIKKAFKYKYLNAFLVFTLD